MSNRKTLLTTLIALTLLGLLVLALLPAPVPVSIATAESGHFAETVEDEGVARLRDPYQVTAPIGGFLRRVTLEPGDEVSTGDVLFELEAQPSPALDPRSREQAREAVAAARARLERATAEQDAHRAQREVAEADHRRQSELHQRGLIASEVLERSLSQRDTTRAAEQAARHAVDVAHFELESARANLAIADGERASTDQPTLAVPAPIAGTVINRERCCEGPINAGDPVMELGDLDTLEVRVDLLSMDAVRVRPGMRVLLERWGGGDLLEGDLLEGGVLEGSVLEGEVRRVEPRGFLRISALGVEEQRVPVLVRILSPREAWRHLGEGYRVEGRFILWEGDDVLQIPTSALFREDDRWMVFVVENRRAVMRAVTPGRRSGLRTQVLDGLRAGEQVITHPSDRIAGGTRVTAES